jgi:hypothetical protein
LKKSFAKRLKNRDILHQSF